MASARPHCKPEARESGQSRLGPRCRLLQDRPHDAQVTNPECEGCAEGDSDRTVLDALDARLPEFSRKLARIRGWAETSNGLAPDERSVIARIAAKIETLRERQAVLRERVAGEGQAAARTGAAASADGRRRELSEIRQRLQTLMGRLGI